jgi:hypothetical protein
MKRASSKKKKLHLLNTYHVKGTFAYTAFCHTNGSGLDECSSFEECDGHELLKTVNTTTEAHSESQVAQQVISEYADDYPDASWLIGYPTVTFEHSELNLATFWTRKKSEQDAIRKVRGTV